MEQSAYFLLADPRDIGIVPSFSKNLAKNASSDARAAGFHGGLDSIIRAVAYWRCIAVDYAQRSPIGVLRGVYRLSKTIRLSLWWPRTCDCVEHMQVYCLLN
jgi:hypothetical protein